MENKQSLLYIVPKSSYYHSKHEVIKEGIALHDTLFLKDRELYTYLLYFTESTYYAKSLIIERLLKSSLYKEENKNFLLENEDLLLIEDTLILRALKNESITHALKLLLRLKKERINNKRTQKLILGFLFDRKNTSFLAIKYKHKLKELLVHALGLPTVSAILRGDKKEISSFLKKINSYSNAYDALEVFYFVFDKEYDFKDPYLIEYVNMRNDFKNNTVFLSKQTILPKEVLEGFNNFYKRNINLTTLITMGNVSKKQKIQLQNTVKKHSDNKIELKIDLNDYTILDIYKYLYHKEDSSEAEIKEGLSVIEKKAKEIAFSLSHEFPLDITSSAVIVDTSHSHFGSEQTKLHPFFKNLLLSEVFANEKKDNLFYTSEKKNKNGLSIPFGETDLTTSLLTVAKKGYKNVILLSDGFENVGDFDKVYKQLKKIGIDIKVLHLNPVFSPKNFSFKSISDEIATLPFTDEKDIKNMMLFHLLNTDTNAFKEIMKQKIKLLIRED